MLFEGGQSQKTKKVKAWRVKHFDDVRDSEVQEDTRFIQK
jgi:hypothetical protein